jgi:LPS-assembly lipoprotein
VREFELFYTVSYRLKDKGQSTWARSQSIENRRDFSYADAEALGKAYEEVILYDNMRSDTIRQIMRALSAHQPSVSNQSEETETPQ